MVKSFIANFIEENTYVVDCDGEAAIIDCGAYSEVNWKPILEYIRGNNLQVRYALQTHTHFDHIFGLCFVDRDFGIKPMCHAADLQQYINADETTMALMRQRFPNPLPPIKEYLTDGQKLQMGAATIEVIHTPGHTPGGVCFYIEKEGLLFSGDTLFAGSVGRTDLPGGNMSQEIESIQQRLMQLPPTTIVYPGHGPKTTIQHEKACNPYI